jgi:NADH-quinone oxidoreductase subunit M
MPFVKLQLLDMRGYIIIVPMLAMLYSALLTVLQTDFRTVVSCISSAHMSIIMMGVLSCLPQGTTAALLNLVSHSAAIPALFILAHIVEHSVRREGAASASSASEFPKTTALFVIIACSSVLTATFTPPFPSFTGALMIMNGYFSSNFAVTLAIGFAILGGGCGVLKACQSALSLVEKPIMGRTEQLCAVLMTILMAFLCVYPEKIVGDMNLLAIFSQLAR